MGIKFCHPESGLFDATMTTYAWSHLSSYQPFGLTYSAPFIICGCTEKTSERVVHHSYLDRYLRMGSSSLGRYLFLFISKKQPH